MKWVRVELSTIYNLILHYFSVLSAEEINVATCCHILSVVGDVAAHLNEDTKGRIVSKWRYCGVKGAASHRRTSSDFHLFPPPCVQMT